MHDASEIYNFFGDNNLVPFHLRRRETLLKPKKVSKYFVQDSNFEKS